MFTTRFRFSCKLASYINTSVMSFINCRAPRLRANRARVNHSFLSCYWFINKSILFWQRWIRYAILIFLLFSSFAFFIICKSSFAKDDFFLFFFSVPVILTKRVVQRFYIYETVSRLFLLLDNNVITTIRHKRIRRLNKFYFGNKFVKR